jgi:ankyrin repeat protein
MEALDRIEAIYRAVMDGDAVGVARMLDENPELLSSECYAETLLTQAAYDDHVGVVRVLLERGADVNRPNDSEDTALHLAALFGYEEVVSALLGSGADISRRDDAGWTVLMCACSSGSVAVVRRILRSGESGINERSEDGCTALWVACDRGNVDIIRALLLAGANHTIPDNAGTTPQQAAGLKGRQPCVALIKVSTHGTFLTHGCTRCGRHLDFSSLCACSGGRTSRSVPMSSTRPGRYTETPPRASKPLQPQCPPT